jgi:hypothetical protein
MIDLIVTTGTKDVSHEIISQSISTGAKTSRREETPVDSHIDRGSFCLSQARTQ